MKFRLSSLTSAWSSPCLPIQQPGRACVPSPASASPISNREYWAHRHDYDRGTLTGETYWHKAAQGAGITLDPVQLADLLVADVDLWTQLNLPMVEWAQRLQRAGIRTGILSNMPDAMETGIVAKFDWIDEFDHHTWSHSLKIAKPEAAIYAPRCRRPQDRPGSYPLHRRSPGQRRGRHRRWHAGHPISRPRQLRPRDETSAA